MAATDSATSTSRGGARGFLAYWAPPVLIGLAVGLVLAWGWRALGVGKSDVDRIVERWQYGEYDANEKLASEIAALGASARSDVLDALRDRSGEHPYLKVWIAQRLLEEPFFDNQSLVEAARGDDPWMRRCAAVALALALREEADADIVMPGILDWLSDLGLDDHELPVTACAALGPLPASWEPRARDAMVALARKRPPLPGMEEDDWIPEDRDLVIQQGLVHFLPDESVVDLLHEVMVDEDDDYAPRVAAVRVLSENGIFDRFEAWKQAAASSDSVVRQAVAENLFRTQERRFGEVLAPLHVDEDPQVRAGSLDTQKVRRQPTMLPVMDQLLEDHDEWVRFAATEAVAAFKDDSGTPQRAAVLIRMLEESDEPVDVEGAVLALSAITDEVHGFREVDVHPHMEEVEETALAAFMKDPDARAEAAAAYRAKFGGATYTDADRIAALEKLRQHADPENRARAEELLATLR